MRSIRLRRFVATLAVVVWTTAGAAQNLPPQSAVAAQPVQPAWIEVRGGAWQVPPELLHEMLQRLQEGATHADLRNMARYPLAYVQVSDYTVQYRGELQDGARVVRLAGGCHKGNFSDDMLASQFLVVMDGGACFFDAVYLPGEHRFDAFAFHGRA